MEHDTLQRRSAATIKNMGVNSYSQIVSAFRAQGDLTEDKLTILPVLQNALGISRERHTAEVKRALYDEQLSEIASSINPSSNTMNWDVEANYMCPTVVHHPPNNKYVQLAEHVLQTTPPTTIIQHPHPTTTTKLNTDLQRLVNDEIKQDGIINATQQPLHNIIKQNFNNFNNTDINGSKVIRLVRAKQATKRKSSLDTLIEVVQKELLRVNGQTCSISPSSSSPPHYSQTRSLPTSKQQQNQMSQSNSTLHRSFISSVLPSSHPGSLTSQSNHAFKIARKHGHLNLNNTKRLSSLRQGSKSFSNDDDDNGLMENDDFKQYHFNESIEDIQSGPENIEEIVRDTVDRLVAITLLNNAPFIVNMFTAVPGNGNSTNTESKLLTNTIGTNSISTVRPQSTTSSLSTISKSDYYRNDLALLSSTASDLRNSMQQTSPIKQSQSSSQQQIHHPQLIIQPATTTQGTTTTTSTLFVAPRILNFQTVVPKPTTNIQIGNTKIILVSPSNITQHLPHSTTSIQPTSSANPQQQQCLVNNSPVKLVKFTTTNNNNNNPITTRSTVLPMNATQTSTLNLPRNIQIVIPSQKPSTIQLNRTLSDDANKSLPTATTFRPVTTVPLTLTTCTVDQIPQAAQEVTVTTSPTSSPPLTITNTSDLQQQQQSIGTTVNVISSNANNQSPNSQQRYFLSNSSENNNGNVVTFNNNGSTIGKSRRRSSSSAPTDKPVGKILRPIAKVLPVYSPNNSNNNHHHHAANTDSTSPTPIIQQQQQPVSNITITRTSPTHDEMIKSAAVNFQQQQPQQLQRPASTHGPMIYRMTSVNPNVPVFRVRTATAPTSTTVMNKSIKTDAKPISVTTATSMCYEPKQTHNTPTASGSVSVLACFKTTKKRNKERAIMPRPSAIDSNDTSHTTTSGISTANTSFILNGDMTTGNSSLFPSSSSTPTRLVQQTSVSSTLSDDNSSNMLSLSMQEQNNDTTTSSSNSIPIPRNNTSLIKTITSPLHINDSPSISPIQSGRLTPNPRPLMEDKCIQCINEQDECEDDENSIEQDGIETTDDEQMMTNATVKKRKERTQDDTSSNDESWTVAADSLLRDVLSQYGFRFLDVTCQQSLSSKFDLIQTNLVSGMISSKEEFYNSVLDIKRTILEDGLSKISEDNLEKAFNYFEVEFPKLTDETNERKRTRRE